MVPQGQFREPAVSSAAIAGIYNILNKPDHEFDLSGLYQF